jgi:hypothetical protein
MTVLLPERFLGDSPLALRHLQLAKASHKPGAASLVIAAEGSGLNRPMPRSCANLVKLVQAVNSRLAVDHQPQKIMISKNKISSLSDLRLIYYGKAGFGQHARQQIHLYRQWQIARPDQHRSTCTITGSARWKNHFPNQLCLKHFVVNC